MAEIEEDLDGGDGAVWALWGSYDRGTLLNVQQGMYQVQFEDGSKRWATVMELALADYELPDAVKLEPGETVLLPDSGGVFVVATLLKADEDSMDRLCEVRREDEAAEVVSDVPRSRLALPLASGAMLGAGAPLLRKGTAVYALRGRWLPAQVVETARGLHRLLLQLGGRQADVWVSGGQLAPRSEPADPAALVPGARVVAPLGDDDETVVEGELVEVGDDTALVGDDSGGEPSLVPLARLRLRYDACFRVLAPTGGYLRGEVAEQAADGLYRIALAMGGHRWASAAELATAAPAAAAQLAALPAETLVGVMPQNNPELAKRWDLDPETVSKPRSICSAVVPAAAGSGAAPQAEGALIVRRPPQQRLTVVMGRKNGRFGLDLDANNRVVTVQPGSGAEGIGLQRGDVVIECDGVMLGPNLSLTAAVKGKERVVLGLRIPGDDSEDPTNAKFGWEAAPERLRLPLLCKPMHGELGLGIGSEVFVLAGPWREAVVEEQEDGFYLLHFGRGERRWASSGEIAWHDIAPMPYDVARGKQVLAWHEGRGWMESAKVTREKGSKSLELEYDAETVGGAAAPSAPWVAPLAAVRERWHVPLRVLAIWGNYHKATVVESMSGLLRLDFGGGSVRWALAEETLRPRPPDDDELIPGTYVAASTDGSGASYARAMLLGPAEQGGGDSYEVMCEDGRGAVVAAAAIRLPRRDLTVAQTAEAQGGGEMMETPRAETFAEGDEVYAVFGSWHLGFVNDLADADPASGRVQAVLTADGRRWSTSVSPRELVRHDGGDVGPDAPVWQLQRGAPVAVRTGDGAATGKETWAGALVVKPLPDQGEMLLLSDGGEEVTVRASDVRPRDGSHHPVTLSRDEGRRRALRFTAYAAAIVQKFVRSLMARREVARRLAAVNRIQSCWRAQLIRRQLKRRRKAATRIEAAARGMAARKELRRLRMLAEQGSAARDALEERRREAATAIQAAARRRLARAELRRRREEEARRQAAATRIEAVARGMAARKELRRLRRGAQEAEELASTRERSAVGIEAVARGRQARLVLWRALSAADTVAAAARGRLARKRLARARAAAVALQAVARMVGARRRWRRQLSAAVTLEAAARGLLARKLAGAAVRAAAKAKAEQEEADRRNAAATRVQAAARGRAARRAARRAISAAIAIEAAARRMVAARRLRRGRGAAGAMQAAARGASGRRGQRRGVRAAVALQAGARGMAARRLAARTRLENRLAAEALEASRQQAATRLQAAARGMAARRGLWRGVAAAIALQSTARAMATRRALRQGRAAATVLQAAARRGIAERGRWRGLRAAVTLQAAARGMAARRGLWRGVAAAVALQSTARAMAVRRVLRPARAAATALQAAARRKAAVRRLQHAMAAAVAMQTAARGRAARVALARAVAAATFIAAVGRGMLARRERRRKRRARNAGAAVASSIVLIQAYARGMLARRLLVRLRHHRASSRIQARARGVAARAAYRHARAAATTIATAARGMAARRGLWRGVAAAVALQSTARAMATRRALRQGRAAATVLQAAARKAKAWRWRRRRLMAAVIIEAGARGLVHRRRRHNADDARHAAAVRIQKHARGLLGRRLASARASEAAAKKAERAESLRQKRLLREKQLSTLLGRAVDPTATADDDGGGFRRGPPAKATGLWAGVVVPESPDKTMQIYQSLGELTVKMKKRGPPRTLPPLAEGVGGGVGGGGVGGGGGGGGETLAALRYGSVRNLAGLQPPRKAQGAPFDVRLAAKLSDHAYGAGVGTRLRATKLARQRSILY